MRRTSTFIGGGLALLATPALADAGAHHGEGLGHFLTQHGLAAGLVALAVIAAGTVIVLKRKG